MRGPPTLKAQRVPCACALIHHMLNGHLRLRHGVWSMEITDQEIHSLHPQKLSLAERHTQKQTITCASLQSTAAPVLFPKNQIKILTPFLKTLPGPPFTWSKIQSPYQEQGCRPVEKRGGSLAPPHLYVAPACFRALVYIFPSVFLTHRPLCTCHTPVTFLPSPSEGP